MGVVPVRTRLVHHGEVVLVGLAGPDGIGGLTVLLLRDDQPVPVHDGVLRQLVLEADPHPLPGADVQGRTQVRPARGHAGRVAVDHLSLEAQDIGLRARHDLRSGGGSHHAEVEVADLGLQLRHPHRLHRRPDVHHARTRGGRRRTGVVPATAAPGQGDERSSPTDQTEGGPSVDQVRRRPGALVAPRSLVGFGTPSPCASPSHGPILAVSGRSRRGEPPGGMGAEGVAPLPLSGGSPRASPTSRLSRVSDKRVRYTRSVHDQSEIDVR